MTDIPHFIPSSLLAPSPSPSPSSPGLADSVSDIGIELTGNDDFHPRPLTSDSAVHMWLHPGLNEQPAESWDDAHTPTSWDDHLISNAQEAVRSEAFHYVMSGYPESFVEMLLIETLCHRIIPSYIVSCFATTDVETHIGTFFRPNPLRELLRVSLWCLSTISETYFHSSVKAVLEISRFAEYHGPVGILYANFKELKRKFGPGPHNVFSLSHQEILTELAKGVDVSIDGL